MLLISTPFRLLGQRGNKEARAKVEQDNRRYIPPGTYTNDLVAGPVASVSEHTTERLEEYKQTKQKQAGE
jgi:hypothetical protein